MKARENDEFISRELRLKLRLDYKGEAQSRFFFGGKTSEQVADEIREQRAALLRNVPYQGITINDIDLSLETYSIYDEFSGDEVSFAPIILDLNVNSIEDVIRFIMQDEFRKIDVLEPEEIVLNRQDLERLLFKINEEMRSYKQALEKRLNK